MKKFFLMLTTVVILGALITLYHVDKYLSFGFPHPLLEAIKEEIEKTNAYSVTSYPEDYRALTTKEYKANIEFPIKKALSATLHSTRIFSLSHDLSSQEISTLLEILNDSASYEWGELGTPCVHYYFTFYDADDKAIGVTTIDVDGMAYSSPNLARMKWGRMERMDEVLELIKEIEE